MSRLVHPKRPCADCPWRADVKPGQFPARKFRDLARSAYDMSPVLFTCHKSTEAAPTVCAGFLLKGADHNLAARMGRARGELHPEAVSDGGFPLHADYRAMAIANGVRADDPALRPCRANGYGDR